MANLTLIAAGFGATAIIGAIGVSQAHRLTADPNMSPISLIVIDRQMQPVVAAATPPAGLVPHETADEADPAETLLPDDVQLPGPVTQVPLEADHSIDSDVDAVTEQPTQKPSAQPTERLSTRTSPSRSAATENAGTINEVWSTGVYR